MTVVVSDFEVVAEAPQDSPAVAEAAAPPAAAPTPHEIEQVMRRQEERAARLRAD